MIFLFGDSHCKTNFQNLRLPHRNLYRFSLTMNRIGRDGIFFQNAGVKPGDIVILQFGEVDCRCHIGKQISIHGRLENEVVDTLANSFVAAILLNPVIKQTRCIISCVTPPIDQEFYEKKNGPITHDFPFVGTNEIGNDILFLSIRL